MKISTITCHRAYNYGAVLQAYALQQYLIEKGHESEILDYIPSYSGKRKSKIKNVLKFFLQAHGRIKCKKAFGKFIEEYLKLSKKSFGSYDEILQSADVYDLYITGSDQVWNMNMCNGNDDSYFLKFVPESAKKISYAASISMDNLSKEQEERFKLMLEDYIAVSVREKTGVNLLENLNIDCYEVCDPVFLLDSKKWENIATDSTYKEDYILIYAFYNQKEIYKLARKLAKEKNCKVYSIGTGVSGNFLGVDKYFWAKSPNEFINLIKEAKAVVTNSFHGISFSIIFNKPLYAFKTEYNVNSRIIDVLKKIDEYKSGDTNLVAHIEDYAEVNKKMACFIEFSKSFLQHCGI